MREVYDIQTPTSLLIGDPSYFAELADKNTPNSVKHNMQNLTFTKSKITKSHKARLILSDMIYGKYKVHELQIIVTAAQHLDVYSNNQFYPDEVVTRRLLGCDTAKYIIAVTHGDEYRDSIIQNGGDGYYGEVMINKRGFGFVVCLTFPSNTMTEQEIRQTLAYLFKCEEIKNI